MLAQHVDLSNYGTGSKMPTAQHNKEINIKHKGYVHDIESIVEGFINLLLG